MEEDDGAGMDASQKFFECFLFGRLFILVPVYIGEAPEKCAVSHVFCHLQIGFTVFSLGRTAFYKQFIIILSIIEKLKFICFSIKNYLF